MSMPTGLLAWGQAGVYNAVDDRLVIAALANNRNGVVKAPVLTAGSGLTVNLAGGWLAIASAADGTSVVVGSRNQVTISVPAGGGSARNDALWCDISPDQATWTLSLLAQSQLPGRLGVLLANISVPAGANSASAFGFSASQASYGAANQSIAVNHNRVTVNGTMPSGANRTMVTVPAGQPGASTDYLFRALMVGEQHGGGVAQVTFAYPGGISNLIAQISQSWNDPGAIAGRSWQSSGTACSFQIGPMNAGGVRWRAAIEGHISVNAWSSLSTPQQLALQLNTNAGMSLVMWEGVSLEVSQAQLEYPS